MSLQRFKLLSAHDDESQNADNGEPNVGVLKCIPEGQNTARKASSSTRGSDGVEMCLLKGREIPIDANAGG